jgi:hypothetical protein
MSARWIAFSKSLYLLNPLKKGEVEGKRQGPETMVVLLVVKLLCSYNICPGEHHFFVTDG